MSAFVSLLLVFGFTVGAGPNAQSDVSITPARVHTGVAALHLIHSGAFSMGAAMVFEMLPAGKLGIVVLTNGSPSGVPESIAKMFYDAVEFGKIKRNWYDEYSKAFAQLLAPAGDLVGKKPPRSRSRRCRYRCMPVRIRTGTSDRRP